MAEIIGPVDTAAPDQRKRRGQWLIVGVTAAVVAGALVTGLTLTRHAGTSTAAAGSPALVVAAHQVTPKIKKATTKATTTAASVVIPQPPGPKSPATAATIIYRLKQLLPAGSTSGYAGAGGAFGQLYLDRGQGPGMLRMDVAAGAAGNGARYQCTAASKGDVTTECLTLPGGARATVTRISDNCIQSMVIDVDHGNGADVQLNVGTCLAWNGKTNPPGPSVLTENEALAIAADPSWGRNMDSGLVAAAQQAFPHLPSFS
jgi:hypothetical protein